jgi:tungstate transport system ATP-binding protein
LNAVYELRDVEFAYNGAPVLKLEKFDIGAGEIVALEGPNGSGKTTLLHILAFLRVPMRGSVRFMGTVPTPKNLVTLRRRTALLLQHPYLFTGDVLSNVAYGLRIRGEPRRRCVELALNSLDKVGLSGYESRDAKALSGGEAQRVALARALVLDPDVFLLDEPSNHMDEASVSRIEEVLAETNRVLGKAVVFASHDPRQAARLAHRTLRLEGGRLCPDG